MTEQSRIVCVYIFDMEDGRTPQERLEAAVEEYCRACRQDLQEIFREREHISRFLRVERTETGKPYFPECTSIHFSISHSGTYWACAIAGENVGLDLQEHTLAKGESREEAAVRFRKMAHRFFHPKEAGFVDLDSYHNFFTVWTAREAYVKHTGQGIDKYFSEHCVVPREETWRQISGLPETHIHASARSGQVIWQALGKWFWKTLYNDNYTVCICTETPCECKVQKQIFDPA